MLATNMCVLMALCLVPVAPADAAPGPTPADEAKVVAVYNRAVAHGRKHEWREAIALYDEVLALDPGFSDAQFNRATAYDALGEVRRAESDYVAVGLRTPNDPELWLNLSRTRARLGRFAEALADAERASALAPKLAGLADARWQALVGLGRLDDANALKPDRKLEEVVSGRLRIRWAVPVADKREATLLGLEQLATNYVRFLASLKPMQDGTRIRLGFFSWRIVGVGESLVAFPGDLSRLPQVFPSPEVYGALRLSATQRQVARMVGVDAVDTWDTDLVWVDPDAIDGAKVVMHRLTGRRDGHSGWVVGPATRADAEAYARRPDAVSVLAGTLLTIVPAAARAMLLPAGFRVELAATEVASVRDPAGVEVWPAAKGDEAPASAPRGSEEQVPSDPAPRREP